MRRRRQPRWIGIWLLGLVLGLGCLAAPDDAHAQRRARSSGEFTVPVDVAAGPSFFAFGGIDAQEGLDGPIYRDQPWHYGLRFEMAAVIDYEWVRKHPHMVPREYRRQFTKDTIVYYRPRELALIPRSLFISPKTKNTGIYGLTWEFGHVGLALISSPVRFSLGAGLLFSYAFIHSDTVASPTHFIRPGVDLGAELLIPFGDTVGISLGWDSHFYLPQDVNGSPFALGGFDNESLWHLGETFLMFHYKFPYTTSR